MKITNVRTEQHDGRARIAAHVQWEDNDRPARDIFYETDIAFADRLNCDPNVFVAAAFAPALSFGEKRIAVEGSVCPRFNEGVRVAAMLLRRWYGKPRHEIPIEPTKGFVAPRPPETPRASCFISGGVDSLGMIRANRLNYPLDHPLSFTDAYFVHGIDMAVGAGPNARMEEFERFKSTLEPIAEDAKLTLIPVFTNFKTLEPDIHFWFDEFIGPGLASIGLAMSARNTDISHGSSDTVANILPTGTHPIIDPSFSTAATRVHYEQAGYPRLDKVRLIADWPIALQNLRVCFYYDRMAKGAMNCGRCQKCLYTEMELLVCGKLADAPTFARNDMTVADVKSFDLVSDTSAATLRDLVGPMEQIGRPELARVLRNKLRWFNSWPGLMQRKCIKAIRTFDRNHLGGRLQRAHNRRTATPPSTPQADTQTT